VEPSQRCLARHVVWVSGFRTVESKDRAEGYHTIVEQMGHARARGEPEWAKSVPVCGAYMLNIRGGGDNIGYFKSRRGEHLRAVGFTRTRSLNKLTVQRAKSVPVCGAYTLNTEGWVGVI